MTRTSFVPSNGKLGGALTRLGENYCKSLLKGKERVFDFNSVLIIQRAWTR